MLSSNSLDKAEYLPVTELNALKHVIDMWVFLRWRNEGGGMMAEPILKVCLQAEHVRVSLMPLWTSPTLPKLQLRREPWTGPGTHGK